LLAGCAAKADVISFDRATFAVAYTELAVPLRQACAGGRLPKDECDDMEKKDKAVRRAILTPTKEADSTDAIVGMFLKIGSAAARAYGFPVPAPK
jgi:hypothetical protein